MAFFKQFPIIKHDTAADGIINDVVDMYRHVDVNDVLIDDASTYTYYEIKNGERPDTVSSRLYGTPDYYWTFFVANDTLKSGLNSWPMEYNQFREWIDQEYGEYSIMVFAPVQKRDFFEGEEIIEHIDYFGGLNLDKVDIVDSNNNTASILKFDINSLQLWVHDVSNPTFFEQETFSLKYQENPYIDGDVEAFEDYEKDRLQWLKDIYSWSERNHPTVFKTFIEYTNFTPEGEDEIKFDTLEYYELFYNERFTKIIFEPRIIHPKSFNAAKHYIDADREDNSIISGYQAYNLEYNLGELEIEPYFRGQLQEYLPEYSSFTKGNIIDQLSNTYTNTYTIGSYTIYRPDPVSNSVSYLEHEEEENFEKRKIRIIRKNVIDSFVDRYKELINS
jgi:hypothetical protein